MLGDASALAGEVGTFRQQAEKAKNDWDSRQGSFDETVHKVEELEAWEDAKAPALRGLVDGIRTYVNQRQYAQASTTLDQLLPKLAPIYEEYLRQKEAKPQYEQQLAEQTARLDPLKAADRPSQPMTAKAGEADSAMQQAKGKADSKDFVGGLEQLGTARASVDELDRLTNDPQRQQYLTDSQGVQEVSTPQPEPAFQTMDADWAAIGQSQAQAQPLADSGDYAGANQALADSKAKREAFQTRHDELVQQKQSFEDARTQLQPRLDALSVSEPQYAKLQPMQQELDAVTTQMEASAQAEDFGQALTQVQDLSSKLDALEQAKTEIDQKKQEYETALAALQPRLDAVSVSDPAYAKIEPQLQEITQARTTMQASAQAGDYDQANTQLQDLTAKVDAYEQAKTEIDQKKQEYETALAALQPRLDAVSVSDPAYGKIEPQLQEITQARTTMEASAQAGDYDQANAQLQDLTTKVDAYEKAKAEIDQKKQEYETALAALQPRLDAVSVSDPAYAKIEPQLQEITQARTTMEASAQTGDYDQANTQLQDLTTKVDAYEKAKTEIDQNKQEYETALAALQAKLPTACPVNAKLSAIDGEITTLKGQMEAAATSNDYAKALEVAKQVSAKADEFQKALAEFEKNKQDFEAALTALQPKLPTTCPVNAGLAERHSQIMALKGQMEAAANSQDYVKALELAKQLNGKVDAYQKAVKETPPSPEKVKEVQDLITAGKKEEALQKAMENYGVDQTQAKKIVYDATVSGEASTSKDGKVRVGDAAFASPGWLASSAAHETEVHVNKQGKADKWYTGTMGTAIQEVQAYDHEIANAHKYNLTDAEIKELKKRRKEHYDQLNGDYKNQADAGNYEMKPGEEAL
ncbi:MAG: hypothetical protein IPP87_03620 [Ideonella sp.]|nr:hypothetical protein [Ideonella sp.]